MQLISHFLSLCITHTPFDPFCKSHFQCEICKIHISLWRSEMCKIRSKGVCVIVKQKSEIFGCLFIYACIACIHRLLPEKKKLPPRKLTVGVKPERWRLVSLLLFRFFTQMSNNNYFHKLFKKLYPLRQRELLKVLYKLCQIQKIDMGRELR